jgi:hypothetical protein
MFKVRSFVTRASVRSRGFVFALAVATISAGSAHADDDVLCVQEELALRGLDPGPLDGLMGNRTRTAAAAAAAAEQIILPALSADNAGDWCLALRPWHRLPGEVREILEQFLIQELPAGTVGAAPLFRWEIGWSRSSVAIEPEGDRPFDNVITAIDPDGVYRMPFGLRGDHWWYPRTYNEAGEITGDATFTGDLDAIFPLAVGNSSFALYQGYSLTTPEGYSGGRYCEVLGEELVTIQGTSYDTFRIACTSGGTLTSPDRPRESEARLHHFWYAPSVQDFVLTARVYQGELQGVVYRTKTIGP